MKKLMVLVVLAFLSASSHAKSLQIYCSCLCKDTYTLKQLCAVAGPSFDCTDAEYNFHTVVEPKNCAFINSLSCNGYTRFQEVVGRFESCQMKVSPAP